MQQSQQAADLIKFFSTLCFLDKYSGSRATEGQFCLQSLSRAWQSEGEISQELFYQPATQQRSLCHPDTPCNSSCPQVFCSCPREGNTGDENPICLGTRSRGINVCFSCGLLHSSTATEELSLVPSPKLFLSQATELKPHQG